ncbi:MAG TPA: ROK family protein [Candidatus Vogelbacteria bacterium]|nr:ROK family protein [Candidatus Vogelbacteria bacterium]
MYLLFDIGGTKIRLAYSADLKSFSEPIIEKTPANYNDGLELLKEMFNRLDIDKSSLAAGGAPGPFNHQRTKMVNTINLPDWKLRPLKDDLEKIFSCPVFLENDTAMVGLGEASFGAGRNSEIMSYFTISTGVGGAKIVNKTIDETHLGFEPGHQIIILDENQQITELEDLISGRQVSLKTGKKPYEITDNDFWDKLAFYFACGLNNSLVHWSPDTVIVGGSMMKEPGLKIDRIIFHLKKVMKIFPELPEIKKAELGDFGGLYGAMHYLVDKQI